MKARIWSLWNRYQTWYVIELFGGKPELAEKYRAITHKLNRYFHQL